MAATTISQLALKADADRESRRTVAAEERAAAQRALQNRLVELVGESWNSEAGIVLFGADTDPRTKNLEWHALDSENTDWELVRAGLGIEARQVSSGKPKRWYSFASDIGEEAVLIIRLATPGLGHGGNFYVQVNGGPILPAPDLASVGAAIRAAQS